MKIFRCFLVPLFLTGLLAVDAIAQGKEEKPAVDPSPQPSAAPSADPTSAEAKAPSAAQMTTAFGELTAKLQVTTEAGEGRIDELKWNSKEALPVVFQDEMNEVRLYATVRGIYPRVEEWTLLNGATRIQGGAGGAFEQKVLLEGKVTQVNWVAISPEGLIQKEKILIVFERWDEYQNSMDKTRKGKRWTFTPGLGLTYLTYNQPGYRLITQVATTIKASFQWVIKPPNWDLATNVFFTALPLYHQPDDLYIKIMGWNLRTGYVLPFVPEPWRVSIQVGAYYSSTFGAPTIQTPTGAEPLLGYQNFFGPQIFPSVRRIFKNGDSGTLYLKYSPMMLANNLLDPSTVGFLDIRNREIAAGVGWAHTLKGISLLNGVLNGRSIFVSLDFANLQLFTFTTDVEGIIAQSVTLGVGMSF